MEANDLTLKVTENGYVNVRANLVLIHPQKGILFHTLPHWNGELTLFGGRVKFAETLEAACQRELEEELGLALPMQKTWWNVNIFTNTWTAKYNQCTFHEFSGFGAYTLPLDYDVAEIEIDEVKHRCQWVTIDQLKANEYQFVPEALPRMLLDELAR